MSFCHLVFFFLLQFQIPSSVCNEPCQPGYRKVSYPGQPFCCYDCISCTDGEYSNKSDKPVQNEVSNTLKIWSAPIACLAPQIALTLTWAFVGQPQKILNTQARPGTILLECGGESPAWAACNFTYLGVVAALCLGLAMKAQKLPSAYNEAKFITFSMLTFFIVALAFVPANSSTQGKLKVATEIFAIIAVASSFLVSIFMPKCYAVVFNRND
uniref:G-protein coupled receptors family 3 profile domain-containing protein n=1 Tax=Eptatretus burgeri TaxID=7764 RepID=A0A8C4QXY7_EPTBU